MKSGSTLPKAIRCLYCLILVLASSGCLGSRSNGPRAQGEATPQPEAVQTASESGENSQPSSGEPVQGLNNVNDAVVSIRAQGAFLQPDTVKASHQAGRGSGFLIDPSGIVVTDAHVVSGADELQVRVGGEGGMDYPASILGLSECLDLAVLQLQGESFPYLQWRDKPVDTSTPVYIAGYPVESPEFSLTKGVIISTGTEGKLPWAALDGVLQYESYPDLGLVGGPVLDGDGQVIGLHQASDQENRIGYGLPVWEAKERIEKLRAGQGTEGIGINGLVVNTGTSGTGGLWIAAVNPGSPASSAGMKSGDLLLEIGGQDLTQDGTLSTYCSFTSSFSPEQQVPFVVLRSGENLSGQLNGISIAQTGDSPSATLPLTSTVETDIVNPDASTPGELFIDANFINMDFWETLALPSTDRYSVTLQNEKLYLNVNRRDTSVYAFHMLQLKQDVRLEAAVETVSGPNLNNISLICRATENGWYEFSMNSGGLWYIWRYEKGTYLPLKSGGSFQINMMKAANQITATCIGNTLTFYVNDSLMGAVEDNRIQGEGQVGVSVSTFEIPGAGVEFDWFRASVP